MENNINKNLSAFALVGQRTIPRGLTKREYIATAMLQGILATQEREMVKYSFEEVLPKLAVMYADELLKQLNEK